jgi:hypothetical protein
MIRRGHPKEEGHHPMTLRNDTQIRPMTRATCRAELPQNQPTGIVGCFGRSETEVAPSAAQPSHCAHFRSSSHTWRGVEDGPAPEGRGSGASRPGHRSCRSAGTRFQAVPLCRYRQAPRPQSVVVRAVIATDAFAMTATATGGRNGCVFSRRESGQPLGGGR